jgi:hypothetical protein
VAFWAKSKIICREHMIGTGSYMIGIWAMSRKRDEKLATQIVEEFHAAGQKGDLAAFKRLLGKYGAHLPAEVKDQLIAEFGKNASLLKAALRGD